METNKNNQKVYLFEEMQPSDLEEVINSNGICYLPLGTLEWHERHLPFGVDSFTAYEICKRTCAITGGCVIPPMYFGTDTVYEENGQSFRGMNVAAKRILPGSIYAMDENFFYLLIHQIIQNILNQGFKKLVIVSGHCEPAQIRVLNKIYDEKNQNIDLIVFPRNGIFFEGSLDHAGEIETRLMMAIRPDLVDLEKLQEPYEAIIGEDPKSANQEDGQKQLENIINQLTSLISER